MQSNPPATRRDGWTAERRRDFIRALAGGANVKFAAARIGLSREGAYRLRRRDPAFAAAWDAAQRSAREKSEWGFVDFLPEELRRSLCAAREGRLASRPGTFIQDGVPSVPTV